MSTRSRKLKSRNSIKKSTLKSQDKFYSEEESSEEEESDGDYIPPSTGKRKRAKSPLRGNSRGCIPKVTSRRKRKRPVLCITKLEEVQEEIIKDEPSLAKIMNEPLLLQDRAALFQMYEVYKSIPPNTEQWLDYRKKIVEEYKTCQKKYTFYSKYTQKEHSDMEEQIKEFTSTENFGDVLYKIIALNTSMENKRIIYRKYEEFKEMSKNDYEYGKLKYWLDWALSLPHDNLKKFDRITDNSTKFLQRFSSDLDKELYGMKTVKEQLLLYVSSKLHNPNMKKCSLGLVGPSGVGKTVVSRLLAKILDFPFEQISFGGVSDTDFLKGHEYTYVGAQPGEIVKCLRRMKYKNGIFFFDEYEKISDNKDISSTLLHITDPSQNSEFRDKYLSEITIDLSHIWFIYSMNTIPTDSALKDRIFIIEVPGYDLIDKIHILKDYLFPKALLNIGHSNKSLNISESTAKYLIQKVSGDSDKGVRTIEKIVNNIVIKLDFIIKHQNSKGYLEGFDLSFNISNNKRVSFPLTLTKKIVDILC